MIELERVTKRYGSRTVVGDVTLHVEAGETLVLLGRSGSGKTTTLKMMNRLVEPSSGTIRVFGSPLEEQPPEVLRRNIGYVIQAVGLFPHYTVAENVAVVPRLLGWEKPRIDARVRELLELVGLPAYGNKRPSELSGGQQQRIGLARALASDPPIVLLDEPFGALDRLTRRQMQEEFVRIAARFGKTMVLVTHDVAEALAVGSRVCLFEGGRVEQVGTAKALLFEPRTEFVRRFFDEGRLFLELSVSTVEDVLPALELLRTDAEHVERVDVTSRLLDVLERGEPGAIFELVRRGTVVGRTSRAAIVGAFDATRAGARRA